MSSPSWERVISFSLVATKLQMKAIFSAGVPLWRSNRVEISCSSVTQPRWSVSRAEKRSPAKSSPFTFSTFWKHRDSGSLEGLKSLWVFPNVPHKTMKDVIEGGVPEILCMNRRSW
jgi:hypothetical protein